MYFLVVLIANDNDVQKRTMRFALLAKVSGSDAYRSETSLVQNSATVSNIQDLQWRHGILSFVHAQEKKELRRRRRNTYDTCIFVDNMEGMYSNLLCMEYQ